MFDDKEFIENSRKFFLLMVSITSLFLFVNLFALKNNILDVGVFLIRPVDEFAFSSSQSVKNFFGVFQDVRTLRGEYYELEEKYLKLEARSEMLFLLEEENLTLKEQLSINQVEQNLVLAEVLFQDWALRNESLLINKGEKDGLSQGDIAIIGSAYVGILTEVYEFNSKIRLPTSKASSLKVMILEEETRPEKENFDISNYLSGVAIGYSNALKVENIAKQGNLQEGNVILINDEKIGEYLYLGNVLSIESDPTATLETCTVELPFDYSNLKYVFVRKVN